MNLWRTLFRLILGRRLPLTQGSLAIAGLHSPLRIRRDRWGIPHIDAQNEHDAIFGVGFCHGQDRTFQLEVLLRVVRGTLCEVAGKAALPIDRLSRRIGFHHSAKQQWPVIGAEIRAMLEAYVRGINAGATHGLTSRPHEFVLLRSRPTPWTPLDCLGLIKLMSWNLASNWDSELLRLKILLEDGIDALKAVDPSYDATQGEPMPADARARPALDQLARDLAEFASVVRPSAASNNWAIAGQRTATGRPLLANDPHLEAALPSQWYLVHVRCPDWEMAGASFSGGPGVIVGHNGFAAWGLTAGLVDNTDLFREQIGPDGCSVREDGRWVPCEVREEVIHVKGDEPVIERVLTTARGPIISPALTGNWESLSLRATWLDPLPIQGLLFAQRARSFQQFRTIMAEWPALSAHLVYADASGTIARQMIGATPRRRRGSGAMPLPGWEPGVGWEPDLVPPDELPWQDNPEQGFVVTANTNPLPRGDGPFLSVDWIDGYRLQAIERALKARNGWDVASTMALQCDQRPLPWEELRPLVLAVPAICPETAGAVEMLSSWDGRLTIDSQAGSVYELFLAEMAQRIVRAKAPHAVEWVLGSTLSVLTAYHFWCFRRTQHLIRLLHQKPAGWFARSWPEEMADALATVYRRLEQQHGPPGPRWAWGRLHSVVMHHPLGRQSKVLGKIFNLGPVPAGGDTDTINQASVLFADPLAATDNIASLRMVVDVGAWGNSRFVLPGGQSGNPFSPHYGDQFALWQRGEAVPIAWTPEEVNQAAVRTLDLNPA